MACFSRLPLWRLAHYHVSGKRDSGKSEGWRTSPSSSIRYGLIRSPLSLSSQEVDAATCECALPHEKSAFGLFTKSAPLEVVSTSAARSPLGSCSIAQRTEVASMRSLRQIVHEATSGRSLSPQHTDRLLRVSKGGERGTAIEVSSTTRLAPTNRLSIP